MRHLVMSLFAVALAGVAAIAATSLMLDTPVHPSIVAALPVNDPAPATPPATGAPPAASPDAAKPGAAKPDAPRAPAGASGAAGQEAKDAKDKDDEGDADPYAGIAPEDIPPDLQYSADSSVSFPTNI